MVTAIPFALGYFLDLVFGDPRSIPHPIVAIGKLITLTEGILRKRERYLKLKGVFLFIIVVSISWAIVFGIVKLAGTVHSFLEIGVSGFIIFQILAAKSLYKETIKIYRALKDDNIEDARKWLSYLVTRDCEAMDEASIIRSTIETISENIVDGITAPLFYIFLGGAPLGMFYKAVNTMDSMVGYKNDKYKDFGFFCAKMDDLFNFIPGRITSIFIVISSGLAGKDIRNSFRILKRDKGNHSSPNSGWAESPVAGALGIQLGGRVSYFGTVYNKPTMGDDKREPVIEDIRDCHKIMFLTSGLIFLVFISILILAGIFC